MVKDKRKYSDRHKEVHDGITQLSPVMEIEKQGELREP